VQYSFAINLASFAIHIDFVYNVYNLGIGRIHWKKYSSLMLGIVGDDEGGGSGLPTIYPIPFWVA